MQIAFELSSTEAERVREAADRLGVSSDELARAALVDLLGARDEDFRAAAEHVLRKNEELYRRLA